MQQQPSPLPFYQLGPENFLLTVLYEDEPLHTDEHPFCQDPTCPCHLDQNLFQEYIFLPYERGLFSWDEASRLFLNQHL